MAVVTEVNSINLGDIIEVFDPVACGGIKVQVTHIGEEGTALNGVVVGGAGVGRSVRCTISLGAGVYKIALAADSKVAVRNQAVTA